MRRSSGKTLGLISSPIMGGLRPVRKVVCAPKKSKISQVLLMCNNSISTRTVNSMSPLRTLVLSLNQRMNPRRGEYVRMNNTNVQCIRKVFRQCKKRVFRILLMIVNKTMAKFVFMYVYSEILR